jgi:hypothetical protein
MTRSNPSSARVVTLGQRLAVLHDVQIEIGNNVKRVQNLIEHRTVLRGGGDDNFKFSGARFEQINQRRHFHSFGPGANDGHHFNRTVGRNHGSGHCAVV